MKSREIVTVNLSKPKCWLANNYPKKRFEKALHTAKIND
ncbi:hypothetical protein AALB_0101 [Agarivorans albus MKT 106]|uniref:Uncharacterized protein n=1 Tax=Agarivorans albus MKT 106 TaxID=1331007 RepID=R9PPH8_AGAAL|nr:hypothetical protein AALB_0101 [Agarivorans albus MKT 106]